MFVSAWVGSFVLNHLINLCFPAMSPRIYLKDYYKNELRGLWLLGGLRNAVTNAAANTYSAFPSGHCGLSILASILSWRIGLNKVYTYTVLVTSVLIVLATQVLRYHYVVDFLFSWIVVAFGVWLGGFHDPDLYAASLSALGLEEHDEEGKPTLSPSPPGARGRRGGAGAFERQPLLLDGSTPANSPDGGVDAEPALELTSLKGSPMPMPVFGMTRSVSAQALHAANQAAGASDAAQADKAV